MQGQSKSVAGGNSALATRTSENDAPSFDAAIWYETLLMT
jgi:hypothetical protein